MATYTLTGTGTHAVTSGTGSLHVTISTLPDGSGNGAANPLDYFGIGLIRPGDGTGYWEPFPVCGGPQWLPLPTGTTTIGYTLFNDAAISVTEVSAPAPLAIGLDDLGDVTLSSPTDTQVLMYQASSAHWINAASTTGGSPTVIAPTHEVVLTSTATSVRLPASGSLASTSRNIRIVGQARGNPATPHCQVNLQLNGDTGNRYDYIEEAWQGTGVFFTTGFATSFVRCIYVDGAGSPANYAAMFNIDIANYAGTTFYKSIHARSGEAQAASSGNYYGREIRATWRSTAAVTSILLYPNSGSFLAGSVFSLYLE